MEGKMLYKCREPLDNAIRNQRSKLHKTALLKIMVALKLISNKNRVINWNDKITLNKTE